MKKKSFLYSGRMQGRSVFAHEWFIKMLPTLKKGYTLGFPVSCGIAVFEFKGIRKPKPPVITFEELP